MKKDKYGVLKHLREVIEEHLQLDPKQTPMHFGEIPQACRGCTDQTENIKASYAEAEKSMIDFIRTQSKPINDANSILELFSISCRAFGIIGHRYDLLEKKVKGDVKADDVLLSEAVREGVDYGRCQLADVVIDSLDDDFIFFNHDTIDRMVSSAYGYAYDYATDAPALMAVYLMRHFQKIKATPNYCLISSNFDGSSCANVITDQSWKNRSLIGHNVYEVDSMPFGEFKSELNMDFISIFTDKLDGILTVYDDFSVESLKTVLYKVAVRAYFGCIEDINFNRIYAAVDRAISIHAENPVITWEKRCECENPMFIGWDSIFLNASGFMSGITYALNVTGLTQFVELIEALGLESQPGFQSIAEKIKAL